jgi:hypothetical protein
MGFGPAFNTSQCKRPPESTVGAELTSRVNWKNSPCSMAKWHFITCIERVFGVNFSGCSEALC